MYYPYSVRYDNGPYISRGAELTGMSDGQLGTISCWVKFDGGDGVRQTILDNGGYFKLTRSSSNKLYLQGFTSGAAVAIDAPSSSDVLAGTGWHHIVISWNLLTGVTRVYLDGAEDAGSVTANDVNIDYTRGTWYIGADGGGANEMQGYISDLFFINDYTNLANADILAEFYNTRGPVQIDTNRIASFGTEPQLYMDNIDPLVNNGTGGDFLSNNNEAGGGYAGPVLYGDYKPHAISFDGSSYLARTSDLAGNANSKVGIYSLWFKPDSMESVSRILTSFASNIRDYISTSATWGLYLENAAGSVILQLALGSAFTVGKWTHLIAAWDLAADESYVYKDGVDASATVITRTDDTIDYTQTAWQVGTDGSKTQHVSGSVADLYFNTAETLDLSVPANLRKFITDDGSPANLGPDGSTPTGSAPAMYMSDLDLGHNRGSGGDFTEVGSPATASGPTAGSQRFFPHAVSFDGGGDGFARGAGLTGAVDGKSGIISFFYRATEVSSIGYIFQTIIATNFRVYHAGGNGKVYVWAQDVANSVTTLNISTANEWDDNAWHHFLFAWDLANTTGSVYVDDVDDGTITTVLDNDIDYTDTNWYMCNPTAPIAGAISEFYFVMNQYLDMSVVANRRKFITKDLRPVNLGLTGANPTGTAPIVYMHSATLGENKGTGGDFTAAGAPVFSPGPRPHRPYPGWRR